MPKPAAFLIAMLCAAPVAAQDRQTVFDTLYDRQGGTLAGERFSVPDKQTQTTQVWSCDTCADETQVQIGWYDFAYNYATTDPVRVLRMVGGACGFDPCAAEPYSLSGFTGLRQSGPRRGTHHRRVVLIVGDRMLMIEVKRAPDPARAEAVLADAEATILPLILNAAP